MKIVSLKELVALPIGTIFAEYEPCVCRGLFRKMETCNHGEDNGPDGPSDFFKQDLLAWCRNEAPPEVDTTPTRWALFDHTAQFAVYEKEDLKTIIAELAHAP